MKMKKIMKKILGSIVLASVLILPVLALAVPEAPTVITNYEGVIKVMDTIANWMFGILLALAVIFLMYAAFLYLTASGESAKIDKAKDIIIYAVVAIVVAVLAKGIVKVAQTIVT